MGEKTKITLSEAELAIASSQEIILTKRHIIQSVYELFSLQPATIKKELIDAGIPGDVIASVPKISRGENYRQLPFVILDYPSVFGGNIFAVRTMFWWGNFFSITIQLSGTYNKKYGGQIIEKLRSVDDLYLCINESAWDHHFDNTNYIKTSDVTDVAAKDFLKVALKFDLSRWNQMNEVLGDGYTKMIGLLAT